MHARRNYIILGIAVAMLLIAVGLEHPFFHILKDGSKSLVFNAQSLVSLAKEISFALIIALIISVGIEAASRREDREAAQSLRRELAEDVFRGVFSRHFNKLYIDTVVAVNLQPTIVRTRIFVDYLLNPVPEEETRRLNLTPGSHLVLRVRNSFILENIAPHSVSDTLKINIPRRDKRFEKISGVRYVAVGAPGRPSEVDIDSSIFDLVPHEWGFMHQLNIPQGETIEVIVEYDLAKDISDSEVWVTTYPTLEADVSVTCRVEGLELGLTARTASPFRRVVSPDAGLPGRWRAEGPMLPHNSLVLWWRPRRL